MLVNFSPHWNIPKIYHKLWVHGRFSVGNVNINLIINEEQTSVASSSGMKIVLIIFFMHTCIKYKTGYFVRQRMIIHLQQECFKQNTATVVT